MYDTDAKYIRALIAPQCADTLICTKFVVLRGCRGRGRNCPYGREIASRSPVAGGRRNPGRPKE
jgi:hypothetical protein